MIYATLMFSLFLISTLFVVVLIGAVVWDGARRVYKRIKENVLDALELVQIFPA